jgi:hypothetical protein
MTALAQLSDLSMDPYLLVDVGFCICFACPLIGFLVGWVRGGRTYAAKRWLYPVLYYGVCTIVFAVLVPSLARFDRIRLVLVLGVAGAPLGALLGRPLRRPQRYVRGHC